MKILKSIKSKGIHKLLINKFEWLKIGSQIKWLRKESKSVIIDGKNYTVGNVYNEDSDQPWIIEDIKATDDPNVFNFKVTFEDGREGNIIKRKMPISYTNTTYHIIFTEGGEKENYKGKYLIISIDLENKKMLVIYLNGTDVGKKQILDMDEQARIIHREALRQNAKRILEPIEFNKPNEYFTLGFLARNGYIRVHINDVNTASFEEMYKQFTGDNAQDHMGHGYIIREPTGGDSYRLTYPDFPVGMENKISLPKDVTPIYNEKFSANEINNRNFIVNLFRMGFEIGFNRDNIQNITSKIQDEGLKKDFLLGANFVVRNENILAIEKQEQNI